MEESAATECRADGLPVERLTRSEAGVIVAAARGRWPITPAARQALVDRLVRITQSPDVSMRELLRASAILVAMDGVNVRAESNRLAERGQDLGAAATAATLLASAADRAALDALAARAAGLLEPATQPATLIVAPPVAVRTAENPGAPIDYASARAEAAKHGPPTTPPVYRRRGRVPGREPRVAGGELPMG